MAIDICVNSASANSCSHRQLTIRRGDGTTRVIAMHDSELVSLSEAEELLFFLLSLRRKGVALSTMKDRIVFGDEATNVKLLQFFGPGAAITKTNIGTAYVNICAGLNGERRLVDLTGCVEFRAVLHANLIGTGPFQLRLVRDSDNVVLYENAAIALTGERELDTNWSALPAAFQGQGQVLLRAQASSATAADDPVFRSLTLGVR